MKIEEAKIKQNKFAEQFNKLKAYPARGSKYIGLKESVSKNAENFHDCWKKIVSEFKNAKLPLCKKDGMKSDSGDQQPDISDALKEKRFAYFLKKIREQ